MNQGRKHLKTVRFYRQEKPTITAVSLTVQHQPNPKGYLVSMAFQAKLT
jgi:hypothetical protein